MNNNYITALLSFLIIGLLGCMIFLGIDAFISLESSKYKEVAMQQIEEISSIVEKKEEIATPQIVEEKIDEVPETKPSTEVNYQSSESRTRYFYSQLDSYSKIIYDGIISNIEDMKSGVATVEFGDKFSSILSKEDGQEQLGGYYQSAIEALTYDNPDIFFLDPTKMYLNVRTTTKGTKKTYNVFITCSEGSNYLAKGYNSAESINQRLSQIEQIKRMIVNRVGNSSTEEKIRYIHDYLIDNISYDQSLSKDNIYNIYGALVNNECVCEGYAKAFKYLLDSAGVDNVIVIGIGTNEQGGTENHAWNYVAIGGKWYAVDVTWDDPIAQGGGITIPAMYKNKYYLKGLKTMSKDHTPNGQFSNGGKIFRYPEISNNDY